MKFPLLGTCLIIILTTLPVWGLQQELPIVKPRADSLLRLPITEIKPHDIDLINEVAVSIRYVNPDSSLYYAERAIDLSKHIHYEKGLTAGLLSQSAVLVIFGNYGKGLEVSLEALQLAEKLHDTILLGTAHHTRAIIYQQFKNDSLAIFNFQKAKIYFEEANKLDLLFNIYNNSGVVYYNMGRYNDALENYSLALALSKQLKNELSIGICYNNFAWVYIKTGRWENVKAFLDSAEAVNKKLKVAELFAWIYQGMGEYYLHHSKLNRAAQFGEKALGFAKSINHVMKQRDIHELMSRIYEKQKNGMKAFEQYKLYKQLADSLFNLELEKKTTFLQLNYEFEKKELELKSQQQLNESSLKQQISQQNWIIFAVVMGFISISVFLVYVQRSQKQLRLSNEKLSDANEKISKQHAILEDANNSKNKLFSIISHDLRGPVGSMWLLLDETLVLIQNKEYLQAEYFIKTVAVSAKQAFELLENLLHWARTQLQVTRCEPEVFSPHLLVDDSLKVLHSILETKQIHVGFNINTTKSAFADIEMMRIVVRNLISNAIKFTPTNGSIIIEINDVDHEFISIEIEDSGVGIDPNRLSQLVNFVDNKSTRGTDGETGTGLGLVLAHELVQLNKGNLSITSIVGKGTKVLVKLPISKN